jgi:hypothetical protein
MGEKCMKEDDSGNKKGLLDAISKSIKVRAVVLL